MGALRRDRDGGRFISPAPAHRCRRTAPEGGPARMFGNALDRIAFALLLVLLLGVALMGAG